MCNAAKHSPGCTCGFGPPYSGRVTIEGVTSWAEEVLNEPKLVRPGLETAGWDEEAITSFLTAFNDLRGARLPRDTLVERLNSLLKRRRELELEVFEDSIKVPLYRFGAPPVPGAVVSYSEGETETEVNSWSLKVFGIGTGDTTELKVNQNKTFVAEAGTCKQVFVKVNLRVARIAVYEGVRRVGVGYRAEVVVPKKARDHCLRGRGCDTIVTGLCREGPDEDREFPLEFWFSGDSSGAIHTDERSWETDVAKEVSLKLQKVVDVGALVRVKRLRKLALAFKLPAGHDYQGYLGRGALWWEKP